MPLFVNGEAMSDKISISPMATAIEARALNKYYSDRCLILANELHGIGEEMAKAKDSHQKEVEALKVEITRITQELDRKTTDLNKAKVRKEAATDG